MHSNNYIRKVSAADHILDPLFPGTEPTDHSNTNIFLVADLVLQCNSKSLTVGFPGD